MRWFGRRQFHDVVQRQLELFAIDHAQLIRDAREKLAESSAEPDADDAHELYGDFDLLAEAVEDELDTMFRAFHRTLEEPQASRYRAMFAKQARRRYRDLLPRLSFDAPDDQLPG